MVHTGTETFIPARHAATFNREERSAAPTGPFLQNDPRPEDPRTLRALLVEDSPDDAELVLIQLRRCGFVVEHARVETETELTEALSAQIWDVVLSDHSLPRFSSGEVIRTIQQLGIDVPCIIVSGLIGEEAAVAAMRSGAADYMLKENLARLGPAIERELREAGERSRRREAERLASYMASHDRLTDLPNRQRFERTLDNVLEQAEDSHERAAVVLLGIDRLGEINDSLGLAAGDLALKLVGRRLSDCVRSVDAVARWGGDQFAVLVRGLNRETGATTVAEKLLRVVRQPMVLLGQEVFPTASLGIALFPNDGKDAGTLLRNADAAMFRAKEKARGTYQFYARAMNARAFERLSLESGLRRAVDRDQLELFYQPQVDCATGQTVGMEALLRWRHPEMGVIAPGEFIPLAEEMGLMNPIGLWVLRTACAQARAWLDEGLSLQRIAVNLSAREFQQPRLVQLVAEILLETGLPPEMLELEIGESAALEYESLAGTVIKDLKEIGVRTSIDDFGTGYCSLNSLSALPVDKLKIDRSFIRKISAESDANAIAMSMIVLARSFGRRVIAEGVETAEQFELLRSHGCDEVQGYFFGRPMPPEEAAKLLECEEVFEEIRQHPASQTAALQEAVPPQPAPQQAMAAEILTHEPTPCGSVFQAA